MSVVTRLKLADKKLALICSPLVRQGQHGNLSASKSCLGKLCDTFLRLRLICFVCNVQRFVGMSLQGAGALAGGVLGPESVCCEVSRCLEPDQQA